MVASLMVANKSLPDRRHGYLVRGGYALCLFRTPRRSRRYANPSAWISAGMPTRRLSWDASVTSSEVCRTEARKTWLPHGPSRTVALTAVPVANLRAACGPITQPPLHFFLRLSVRPLERLPGRRLTDPADELRHPSGGRLRPRCEYGSRRSGRVWSGGRPRRRRRPPRTA